MKDLMGRAIWDYYHQNSPEDLLTETNISESDILPVSYLFRSFEEMPPIEQKALEMAAGKVLDIGSCSGTHSIYLQNQRNLEVVPLDFSPLSIEVCKLRGLKNAVCSSLLDYNGDSFDTLLMLMNGTGIFGNVGEIDIYLQKLFSLLKPGGQVLIDGTDLIYMYGIENGPHLPETSYYGEVDFFVSYKGEIEEPFKMLYLDFDNLKLAAEENGFIVEKILDDENSYLARLVKPERSA